MKIEWEGRAWPVDVDELSLQQAVVMTGRMGTSMTEWEKTLLDPDSPLWLTAVQCFYWLMLSQDGQQVPHAVGVGRHRVVGAGLVGLAMAQ